MKLFFNLIIYHFNHWNTKKTNSVEAKLFKQFSVPATLDILLLNIIIMVIVLSILSSITFIIITTNTGNRYLKLT